MTPQVLIPALLVPLIGYRLYRRFRSHFGPQPIQPKRMIVRMVVLSAVASAFLIVAMTQVTLIAAATAGLALGAIIALVGLKLTQFELRPDGTFYTPNAYIGATVSAILVGRLVYRLLVVMPTVQMAAQQGPGGDPFATYRQSPLTLAILMLTIGYYITYFAGVLLNARKPQLPAP